MTTIVFFEVTTWEKAYLRKRLKPYSLIFFDGPISSESLLEISHAEILSVFIYSKVDAQVLDRMPALKLIATRSTGFDHLDLHECKARGITVSNVPFYGENTVAEHAFALLLSISRNIHKSYLRMQRNDFSIEGLTGFDLKGKTLGVVGGGNIGLHVVRIAKGFGMNVLVYDVRRQPFLAEVLDFEYVSLEDLLRSSDIVSLHVPYNKHTHHLINLKNIRHFKKGAILINTARGAVVDTDALLWGLESNVLGGAGLDVIEGEELIMEEKQLLHDTSNLEKWRTLMLNHRIFSRDNVVFTPHNSFNSKEAMTRILDTTVQNIEAGLAGNFSNVVTG